MANINRVFVAGNLTRDPEVKFIPTGQAVCKFALAINRSYKGKDGEMKKETEFVNCVVWGKQAENCGKYLQKGKSALVEGRIQTRSYEAQDGGKKFVTEIVADSVQFLSAANTPKQEQHEEAPAPSEPKQSEFEENVPF